MTTDSQFYDPSRWQFPQELSDGVAKHTNESTGPMDMVKRDRFELLSAYLDGEVTASERKQVEEWLANDASVQCLYARLLKLRQGLRTLSVPANQQSPEVTMQQVLTRLHRRSRVAWVLGGGTIAACLIGLVSSLLLGGESRVPQLAQKPPVEATKTMIPVSPLMVGLNNPVIEIPKAAVTSPEDPLKELRPQQRKVEYDIN
ncbi:MAG: transcriptional regulator [Desmonostoc vinosum HA7617-LM4]|jgi:anti-sigma factor RsiW|nr:transcriptional regulator [Desmonostoc vinosum HA7617-LM4]